MEYHEVKKNNSNNQLFITLPSSTDFEEGEEVKIEHIDEDKTFDDAMKELKKQAKKVKERE